MAGEFDVFLSYCSADETWVIRLKKALEVMGLRVWRDKDCITAMSILPVGLALPPPMAVAGAVAGVPWRQ